MAEGTIYEKLLKVQTELHAPKNQTGRFGAHRSAEKILEAVKPLLAKHELTLMLTDHVEHVGDRNYVVASAHLFGGTDTALGDKQVDGIGHVRVDSFAWEGEVNRGLDASQITGAASSYARKYALCGLFAIDDRKDADTYEEEPTAKAVAASKPAAVKPSVGSTPELATPLQKSRIKLALRGQHIADDDMAGVLAVDYGITDPSLMTKQDAERILKEMSS